MAAVVKSIKNENKPFTGKSQDINIDAEYREWILEIKQRYRDSQAKAAVKVNSEALLFNWHLGRDLVIRRAEEKWGKGVVEQVSLDLQDAFPGARGFSTTNLWYMKKWYLFYAQADELLKDIILTADQANLDYSILLQNSEVIKGEKLHQPGGEIQFPIMCESRRSGTGCLQESRYSM